MPNQVTVYGAYGHTGRFIVRELLKRGWTPVLAGRDAAKLAGLEAQFPGLPIRIASTDDPTALDRALAGAAAIINCAGPFAVTAPPLVEAALRARIPYLDVAAEIEANIDTLANYADRAQEAGIIVLPAMAFFGGLGDLLATAAVGDWPTVDEISIAYGLSSWQPTAGTRAAGQVSRQRRNGRRITFASGRREYRDDQAEAGEWEFPLPLGRQSVATDFTMADAATISHHVPVARFNSYMTMAAVNDLIDPDTHPPAAADDSGRDIYAVTAPLVVEALERILGGSLPESGAFTAGALFDASDFLTSLSRDHLLLAWPQEARCTPATNQATC